MVLGMKIKKDLKLIFFTITGNTSITVCLWPYCMKIQLCPNECPMVYLVDYMKSHLIKLTYSATDNGSINFFTRWAMHTNVSLLLIIHTVFPLRLFLPIRNTIVLKSIIYFLKVSHYLLKVSWWRKKQCKIIGDLISEFLDMVMELIGWDFKFKGEFIWH